MVWNGSNVISSFSYSFPHCTICPPSILGGVAYVVLVLGDFGSIYTITVRILLGHYISFLVDKVRVFIVC